MADWKVAVAHSRNMVLRPLVSDTSAIHDVPHHPAPDQILPGHHAALDLLEDVPEDLVGGLAAPRLHGGQLLVVPALDRPTMVLCT